MSDYNQLDEFLRELLQKDIEITRTWSEEELRDIDEAVTDMVHQIVASAINSGIFKRLHALSDKQSTSASPAAESLTENAAMKDSDHSLFELIPVGSVAEGTKIEKPDERDMLLMLKVFSNFGFTVTDTVYEQKQPVYKFIYLDEQGTHVEEVLELLREPTPRLAIKTKDGTNVLTSAGFSAYLYKSLEAAYSRAVVSGDVISKQSGQLKVMETINKMMVEMGRFTEKDRTEDLFIKPVIKSTGPATTLTFLWKSTSPDRHTFIDVDIVPNIGVKCMAYDGIETELLFDKYSTGDELHLIPLKKLYSLHKYTQRNRMSLEEQTIYRLSFLPSFSHLEVQMMKDLSPNFRLVYKVLKHFTKKQFHCSCCKPSTYTFGYFIQSYLLKTIIIRHGHGRNSCKHCYIAECVIFILSEFREMARERALTVHSLWNRQHNLFITKPVSLLEQHKPGEWEKEIVGFEKHLTYFLERLDEINRDDSYSFEKYRHFHLKLSNRQKRSSDKKGKC